MTLLEIVQEFCQTTGLGRPLVVMSSGDDQLLQIVGLLNRICRDLTRRKDWQALQFEAVWTSTAGEDQGAMTTLAPNAFKALSAQTIFDRTTGLKILGPNSQAKWQADKALHITGPSYQYRIVRGHLLIQPAMEAGHTLAFEYNSNGCVKDAVDLVTMHKPGFTKDDDEFLLDEALALAGLAYHWRREKGFAFATEFQDYEALIADIFGRDASKPVLNMNGCQPYTGPGIVIQPGSWVVQP